MRLNRVSKDGRKKTIGIPPISAGSGIVPKAAPIYRRDCDV